MLFVDNLNIKRKLLLIGFIPILALVLFSQSHFRDALSQYNQSDKIIDLSELSVNASALVHELQKERGMSAGFLGSKGTKFTDTLLKQHKAVDAKMAELDAFLEDFSSEEFGETFSRELALAKDKLGDIRSVRSRVLSQQIKLAEGIGYYTAVNAQFLGLIEDMATLSSEGSLANSAAAYSAFLQSKERAGIERAVLANVFAKDRFGPNMLNKLNGLITVQDTYLSIFKAYADQESYSIYENTVKGNAVSQTQHMRSVAIEKAETGGFNVDPGAWFAAQTEKINLLKKVENQLSERLLAQTQAIKSKSLSNLMLTALPLLTIALVIYLTLTIANKISRSIEKIKSAIKAVSDNGDFSQRVVVDSKDEIGDSAESINKMLEKMGSIITDVNRVVGGFATGDFKRRVECNVAGDLSLLKDSVNRSAESVESIVKEVVSVVNALAEGDFNRRVTIELSGDLDRLKQGVNSSAEAISNAMAELGRVVDAMGVGDFKQHIQVDLAGEYAQFGARVDTAISSIDRALGNVDQVMHSIANGELDARIDSELPGQLNQIKQHINVSLDTLTKVFDGVGTVLSAVASGDLSHNIEEEYVGAFERLRGDANATVEKLQTVVSDIRHSAEGVRAGAEDISNGNNNLSHRTEQQAANLEQTAASMDEMTSTVKHTAENASRASELAIKARDEAERGGEVVSDAVSAMQEINESSNRIAEIISVIDEIAFQTNLLALNASVEAARAGEQGRGFAVVASEVRNLAGRSATAAKEIKELIEDSVSKVEAGSALVSKSGKTLEGIVTSVQGVSNVVGEIATAADEQSIGINAAYQSIEQLQALTQQNTAMVEEAAAASEELGSEARGLNDLVEFFGTSARAASAGSSAPLVERRSASRPWSGERSGEAPAPASAPPAQMVVNGGFEDDDWDEF